MANSKSSPKRPRVAAAVDFGTHGTGFAWAEISDDNDDPRRRIVHFSTRWQGQEVAAVKTLTAVLVDKRNKSVIAWGQEARRQWLQPDAVSHKSPSWYYQSFKLALQPGVAESGFSHLPSSGQQAFEVTALYLREIYRRAVREITNTRVCTEDDITWCITVPAIWSEHAKRETRKAAVQAGFPDDEHRLRLAYEPEVAALACRIDGMRAPGGTAKASLAEPGSRFTIVDCGGGTVDITSYLVGENGLLEQIGQVCGDGLGSRRLDVAFVSKVLESRLGGQEALNKVLDRDEGNAIARLVDKWAVTKHDARVEVTNGHPVRFEQPLYFPIDSDVFKTLTLDVPDFESRLLEAQGTSAGIKVTEQELETVFEEVMPEIISYVEEQLKTVQAQLGPATRPETVLLVGGFAQSEYLQHRLRKHLHRTATVVTPAEGERAVLAGAVHFCYDPALIRARHSRYTYGYEISAPFEEDKDPMDRCFRSGYGDDRCRGRFSRLIKINEIVPSNHRIERSLYPLSPDQETVTIQLYCTTDPDPRYVDGCSLLGEVTVDVASTKGLPQDKREIEFSSMFGGTEINIRAVAADTQREFQTRIEFEQNIAFKFPDGSSEVTTTRAPKKDKWSFGRRSRANGDSA